MGLVVAMLVAALAIGACSPGELDLDGKACPCISGWVCDPATDTCVRAGAGGDGGGIDATRERDAGPSGVDAGPGESDAGPPRSDAGPAGSDAGPGEVDAGPPPLDPPWLDATFGHRAQITVTNGASAAPVDLPVPLLLDVAALPGTAHHLRLEIARWDPSERTWTPSDYAANNPGVAAGLPVWFGLTEPIAASAADSQYWLYWDTESTTDRRSPNRLFELWESFGTGIGTDFVREDPVSVSMDELVIDAGGSVRSAARWGPGFALDVLMRVPTFAPYFWVGFQRESDFVDGEPWILWINRDWDPGQLWTEVKIGAIGHSSSLEGSHLALDSSEHIYTVERFDDRAVFSRDHVEIDVTPFGASHSTPFQVRLRSSATGPRMRIDWVRVRRVIRPMPEVTLGTPVARP